MDQPTVIDKLIQIKTVPINQLIQIKTTLIDRLTQIKMFPFLYICTGVG